MSNVDFVVVGAAVSGFNLEKYQCNITAGTISLITTAALGGISAIETIVMSTTGNFYFTQGIASTGAFCRIYKTDSAFNVDTSWGTSGYAIITATLPNFTRDIAINEYNELAVIANATTVNTYAFDSTGTKKWGVAATISVIGKPVAVSWTPLRTVIVSFGVGSAAPVKEYAYSDGGLTKIYAGVVSVDYRFPVHCGRAGNIVISGRGSSNNLPIYQYTVGNSTYNWQAVITGQYAWDALYHSNGYLYTGGQAPSGYTYSGIVHKIKTANASVVAYTSVDIYGQVQHIKELSDGSILVSDDTKTVAILSSDTLALVAAITLVNITDLNDVCAINTTLASWVVQTPRTTTYKRQLVAMANNQVWYENPIGTMTELTAARGLISTSKPLSYANFAQKLYVVNDDNFQVIDFVSSRISTASLGTAPLKDTKLTGGTSGAIMYVDFCDSIASTAAAIWGYRTTSQTFQVNDVVTGGATGSISFTIAADETPAPTIRTWTTYGASTVFGVMPASATLLTRYAGRLVLNDTTNPHRWQMTRVYNPYDFLYVINDPLSAIKAGNADAGEVGDIVVATIPFRDEYYVFGCVGSLWLIRGNPAAGGSLEQLSNTVGIIGPKAWCYDDNNILYFMSYSGLYSLSVLGGVSPPQNLSADRLPKWFEDWEYNETKHVITLTFDPYRRGIRICKTVNDTGANEAYWYDLQTDGFYPEQYPNEGGMYCSTVLESQDPNYRKVLYGCSNGYIGAFNDDVKSDTISGTTVAIESRLVTPIMQLSPNLELTSKIGTLRVITAGGNISSTYSDTDEFTVKCFVGDSAEQTLENIVANASALMSATISSPGTNTVLRTKMRGNYFGIKCSNTVVDKSWTLEKIQASHKLVKN